MKMYPTKFVVTGIKGCNLLNGKTAVTPINFGVNEISAGDTVSGEMIVDSFPDQNDPRREVILFKMIIKKVKRGGGSGQPDTESY
jgi:hypothetical protein